MKLSPPSFTPKEIAQLFWQERHLYSQLHVEDIYKLFFQAYYGPTHMNGDESVIRAGIIFEQSQIEATRGIVFQDIGLGKGFLRIGLAQTRNQDDFVDRLTLSITKSKIETGIPWDHWRKTWKLIVASLPIKLTEHMLQEVEYKFLESRDIPSHSKSYKMLNKPHYRIIHHSQAKWINEFFKFKEHQWTK